MSRFQPARDSARALGSRLTGRSAVLVVVLAVLVVSYASSLKAYLQQKQDIDALQQEIAERQSSIDALGDQIDRWQDPAYVKQQARARFGFVPPGSISYVALDEDGNPIDGGAALGDAEDVGAPSEPTAWWVDVWGSVETAGNPPEQEQPADTLGGERGSSR